MGIGMKLGRDRSVVGGGTKGLLGLVGSAGGLGSLVDLGPRINGGGLVPPDTGF